MFAGPSRSSAETKDFPKLSLDYSSILVVAQYNLLGRDATAVVDSNQGKVSVVHWPLAPAPLSLTYQATFYTSSHQRPTTFVIILDRNDSLWFF